MQISDIKKVVVWGLSMHSHTSGYVHDAIYCAFKALNYDAYWFNDETFNDTDNKVEDFDFSNTLFYTLGGHEHKIPLRNDCLYILHNCDSNKYINVASDKNVLIQQVFTLHTENYNLYQIPNAPKMHLYDKFQIFQPWATDLTPSEVDQMINNIEEMDLSKRTNAFTWVGTLATNDSDRFNNYRRIRPFETEAKSDEEVDIVHKTSISPEENKNLICQSKYAPVLCGDWQCEVGFIPCRTFKNISYGHLLATNNPTINELFDNEQTKGLALFDEDSVALYHKVKESYNDPELKNKIITMMQYVRDNHTYINWVQRCLDVLDRSINDNIEQG
jgi:hypothetical protein